MDQSIHSFFLDARRCRGIEEASAMAFADGLNGEIIEGALDVFHGVQPGAAADRICQAMKTISGAGVTADPYGFLVAEKIIHSAVYVAQAYERSACGLAEIVRIGKRVYAPSGVFAVVKMLREKPDHFAELVQILSIELREPHSRRFLAACCGPELTASIKFLLHEVPQLLKNREFARPMTYISCVLENRTSSHEFLSCLMNSKHSQAIDRVKRIRLSALEHNGPVSDELINGVDLDEWQRCGQETETIIEKTRRPFAS